MNLELGIVKEAGDEECRVSIVGSSSERVLPYSSPMKDHRVKVHPDGLVAIDLDAGEVVY